MEVNFKHVLALVDEQAKDEALWCIPEYISEAYIQQELRKLHEAIKQASGGGE